MVSLLAEEGGQVNAELKIVLHQRRGMGCELRVNNPAAGGWRDPASLVPSATFSGTRKQLDGGAPLHHGAKMRLSVNLEDDLYAAARSLAVAENCSISAAVNKLLRRSLENPRPPALRGKRKFPKVKGARRFRSEDVYKLEMEEK